MHACACRRKPHLYRLSIYLGMHYTYYHLYNANNCRHVYVYVMQVWNPYHTILCDRTGQDSLEEDEISKQRECHLWAAQVVEWRLDRRWGDHEHVMCCVIIYDMMQYESVYGMQTRIYHRGGGLFYVPSSYGVCIISHFQWWTLMIR